MREILFRGKRIGNGEWVLSHNIMVFKDGECQRTFMAEETETPIQVNVSPNGNLGLLNALECGLPLIDNSTIGQFTGFTDKNGKKIFEGDIVDITQYDNVHHKAYRCCRSKVSFSNFAFRTNAAPEYEDEEPLSYWFWHDCDFEVIGNIYDNPELLEDKP